MTPANFAVYSSAVIGHEFIKTTIDAASKLAGI